MYDSILITEINDFIFCPVSIYFHNLYGNMDKMIYQSESQINGTAAHKNVDEKTYSTKSSILTGLDVYSEKYNLIGKIDILNTEKKILRERKKKIKVIYDGYIFQIYAQYFALSEMGYEIQKLELYSMDDNKIYSIELPENDLVMYKKFCDTLRLIRNFKIDNFFQDNILKCKSCIYEPACDRSLLEE